MSTNEEMQMPSSHGARFFHWWNRAGHDKSVTYDQQHRNIQNVELSSGRDASEEAVRADAVMTLGGSYSPAIPIAYTKFDLNAL